MKRDGSSRRGLSVLLLALVVGLASGPAMAAGINPDADEILRSMSTYLAGLESFSVSADISNEVITRDGEKLQLNSYASVVLQRPSGLYAARQGRAADLEVFFDGKKLTLHGKRLHAYFQQEVAGSTDDALAVVEGDVGLSLPGTDLLLADPYAALAEGITSSGYHGIAFVQGVECEHLSFREDQVDWQVWVRTGEEPVPMKYVITTKWVTGAPQYSVQFSNWNTRPTIAADRFTFVAPAGTKKLESLPVDEAGELTIGTEGE